MANEKGTSSASTTLNSVIISTERKRFEDAQAEKERLEREKKILLEVLRKKG